MGLEPTTTSLATRYSTTELHPQFVSENLRNPAEGVQGEVGTGWKAVLAGPRLGRTWRRPSIRKVGFANAGEVRISGVVPRRMVEVPGRVVRLSKREFAPFGKIRIDAGFLDSEFPHR